MEELMNLDPTFSESSFKSRVDNVFVMLYTSLMTDNLIRVKHFLSDNVYQEYSAKLEVLRNNNEKELFDEFNIKSTQIKDIRILDDKYEVDVYLVSRYMDYIVDKDTGKYKRGNNKSRIEKLNTLTFEKKKNTKVSGVVRFCSNCGHPMDINNTGYCEYCHTTYNQKDYDWILAKIVVE